MKRIVERITEANQWKFDAEKDSVDKLIAIAYAMGRESAVQECVATMQDIFKAQTERAEACRYYHMAKAIIGETQMPWKYDMRGETTKEFANDLTDL